MNRAAYALMAGVLFLAAGCGARGGDGATGAYRPIATDAVVLWDRQTTESADLLQTYVEEFNADREGLPLRAEYIGDYDDILRKIRTSIQARTLPALAVGYESMTMEYIQAEAVVPLDPFINDPEAGLGADDMADFFPVMIETNKYPTFDNRMYSFPFCKSVLMMYFNKKVLADAGFDHPPATWDELLEQCRQIRAKSGKFGWAVSVDASTVDGMIFSMGGEVARDTQTLFDSPEALRVFKLFETLGEEKLAYQIQPGSYEDRAALAKDQVAFAFRSSSHRAPMAQLIGDPDRWGMARIPQGDPATPRTVLYGPNVCVFNTTPEQERVAWEFVKFFTQPQNSVKWALNTGYLPIRKSAANDPAMLAFWDEWEYNRAAFDCLSFARPEPNLLGWQEVRSLIATAQSAVLSGAMTAEEATKDLKAKADAVLASQE